MDDLPSVSGTKTLLWLEFCKQEQWLISSMIPFVYCLRELSAEDLKTPAIIKRMLPRILALKADMYHAKKLKRLKAGGNGDYRGWGGWMASWTQWTWVWASSRNCWWRGKPGVLQKLGLKESDTTEQLNWTENVYSGEDKKRFMSSHLNQLALSAPVTYELSLDSQNFFTQHQS